MERRQQRELFIYRLLGVGLFRKGVLLWEKRIRHRKGGQNPNYHLDALSTDAIERHGAYLLYNSAIHVVGAGAALFFLLLFRQLEIGGTVFEVFMGLLLILNLYCLLLQRYADLQLKGIRRGILTRMEKRNAKRIGAACRAVCAVMGETESTRDPAEDLKLLADLKEILLNGGTGRIDRRMLPALERFAKILDEAGVEKRKRAALQTEGALSLEEAFACGLKGSGGGMRTEQRALRLSKILGRKKCPGEKIRLVTEDGDTERALQAVLGCDAYDFWLERIMLLEEAYRKAGAAGMPGAAERNKEQTKSEADRTKK